MSTWTTLGKRKIGQRLMFSDGIGTNYSQNLAPTRTFSAPLYVPESSTSSSTTSFQSSYFPKSASEPCNYTDGLPPRLRRRKNWRQYDIDGHKNMAVEGNLVFLHHLLPNVTSHVLEVFLDGKGFTAPVKIAFVNKSSASLEFSHSNVATIAFSLIQNHAACLFAEPSSADSARAATTPEKEVIDLTEIDNLPPPVVERSNEIPSPQDCSKDPAEDISDDSSSEYTDTDISVSSAAKETKPSDTSLSQDISDNENSDIDVHLTKIFELPQYEMNANVAVGGFARPHRGHHRSSAPIGEALQPISPCVSSTFHPVTNTRDDGTSVHVVTLPPAAHNRARRVLLPRNQELPMMTVSMKADLQFFHRIKRHRISRYSIPNSSPDHRHTADAIMIGDTAVIGYRSSTCQVSLVRTSEGRSPVLTELKDKPHQEQNTSSTNKSGVNCLAARESKGNAIHFFTGGYDRKIKLWSVTTPDLETETERLATLSTIPNALAFEDRVLLVGTSKKILTLDLGHLSAKPITAQMDNLIHQIHVHKQAPNVTILEMDSLDFQIQIFDGRKRGFDRTADCSFGIRCGGSMSARSSCRGDTHFSMFAKGFSDGTVRLWDYRNSKRPLLTKTHENKGAVVHTIFTESGNIVCYNSGNLLFIDSRT